ncbi:MAG: M23 family metallopeptidase, partial [Rikenellaceae bacterium]
TATAAATATATAAATATKSTEVAPKVSSYAYPIKDVARLYSANFGEMRPNHFHSGVDIKSDGTSGKQIVSVADGYVSRLAISPTGYGLSIYVTHPNGMTSQYGHLSRFREDIAKYAEDERYRLKKHSINIHLTPQQYPVKRGELIGYSGNTGSSFGPHLHFEIRETKNQRPKNPIAMGVIEPNDKIKPLFFNLYYIESETIDGVVYQKKPSKYELTRQSDGSYRIADDRTVWVGREGHFVVAVSDRKANVTNNFGLYIIEAYRDNELIYRYQQDGFLFSDTRYCNSVSYFPLQRKTSIEHYRLRRQEGLPSKMVDVTTDDGVVRTEAGESSKIRIVAEDDMRNLSTLLFEIKGKDDKDCYVAEIDPKQPIARALSSTKYSGDGIEITTPAGVLYESIPYAVSRSEGAAKLTSETKGVKIHSAEYSIFDYDTPLHKALEVSIEAVIPENDVERAVMVWLDEKGEPSAIEGRYKEGRFTAPIRTAGRFFVASDHEAPTITTKISNGAKLTKSRTISFEAKDNFSGVATYEATLNGEWIALDQKGSTLTHKFRTAADGSPQKIIVKVKDLVGNETTLERSFVR